MSRAAQTAYINADVTTMDARAPRARGLLVADGKISRLLDAAPTGLGKDVRLVDCAGAAIVPGLFDCHAHLTDTGLLAGEYGFQDCVDVAAMLKRVAALPDRVLYAGNFEDHRIAEGRPPLRAELDSVAPDRLVLLTRVDGHSCIVNSAAMKALEVEHLEGVERDHEGSPTGRLRGAANYRAQREFFALLPAAGKRRADERAARMALAAGMTCVHDILVGDAPLEELQEQYRADAALPLRVIPKSCATDVSKIRKLGRRIFGGDIFLDGSIGSRTAAVNRDYCDGDGRGLLYLTSDQLFEVFDEAAESELSLGVHAIGDRAIEEAIAAWERVIAKRGPLRGVRPSIDHFEIATLEQIGRAAHCGMLLSMQPAFDHLWGGEDGMYAQRLGAERALGMNLFKTAAAAGCIVCGGSDSPVTAFSALLGIHSLVNHHVAGERFTVEQALRAYTADAAKLSFDEERRGRLAPGMDADFAVLDRALDVVPLESIKDVCVLKTVVDGEIRYEAT